MNANAVQVTNPQEAFALWLAQNQPTVFQAMLATAQRKKQMAGITDWLSSVGTSLGGAVKSVGSFLTSSEGLATIGTLGTAYLQTTAQRDALRLQTQQMQAGYAPQPVYSVGSGSSAVPYYRDPATGQTYPLTPQLTNQLSPSGTNWIPIALAGGGVLLVLFLLSGRK